MQWRGKTGTWHSPAHPVTKREFKIGTEAELSLVADFILNQLKSYTKFVLTGDLGSGKTALVKTICQKLHTAESPSSPTFSIINEYSYLKNKETHLIYHIDLYRLESEEEALDIGIEEYLDSPHFCFIEWPQIIENLLPEEIVQIQMTNMGENSRKILILFE